MKVDFHCHIFQDTVTPESLKSFFHAFKGYGFYERYLERIKSIDTIVDDNIIKRALFHIKRAKLDKVVLLPASSSENKTVQDWVDFAPDVFIPFYNPPEKPSDTQTIEEIIHQAFIDMKFKGFKILLSFRRKFLNDKIINPVLEFARDHELIVLFHAGWPPPGTRKPVLTYSNPLHADEIINSFPKVKFIVAHMGFPFSDIAIALATQYPNVYLDISNLPDMAPFRLKQLLLQAKDIIGTQKILFGSDGFIPESIEATVNYFESVDYLTERDIKNIMGLNAKKLLNLRD